MDDRETAGEAARRELIVQAIGLVAVVLSGLLAVHVQRSASDPDWSRTWRMRAAKQSERVWARVAGWSWRRAEQARTAYEAERP